MISDLGQPIAYGRTAEVYAWGEGQVLKLFHNWFEPQAIEYERCIARAVHTSGLPVPAVDEVIRVNGRNGLVYQRVDGASMMSGLFSKPWKALHYARRMAELHAWMHASVVQAELPSQRLSLARKIRRAETLPAHLRSRALAALESLPDGDRICHGDFHPGNILLTGRAEIIIDWIDASCGNPLADLARTSILGLGAVDCQIQGVWPKAILRLFHAAYLRRYFRLRPGGDDEYQRWLPVVAAARLSENISELQTWLIDRAEAGLRRV